MNRTLIVTVLVSLIVGIGGGYVISYGQISGLQSEVTSLESEVSRLTTDYSNVNTTYNELRIDYGSLNSTFNELQDAYEQLEETYELLDTAGLIFDGLRISDLKVIKGWLYSDVVGNVTNMSNKTMSEVYVVIFTFEPDGTLDYYYVRTVENLAVNEANDFKFSSVLEENQKFNVLAVGNYGFADIETDEVARLLALLEEANTRISELEQMVKYEVYVLLDKEYYQSIKNDLEKANKTILVAMYSMIYDPDDSFDWANDIIRELVYAKERGVNVTVIIEYRTYWDYMDENVEAYDYLSASNVTVRLDNETDTDHMKLVIIDDNIVYVGSHNWSESGLYYDHETSVKIVSEDISEIFKAYFETI